MTEEDFAAEGDNGLPRLMSAIGQAEDMLRDTAIAIFRHPTLASGMTVKTVDLGALWPTPGSADALKVIPEIAMDINKLLAYNRIPNTLGTGAKLTDVGEQIANQLFNHTTIKTHEHPSVLFNTVDVLYNGRVIITGGMIFYKIPLGNPGNHEAWHSHTRLHYVSSSNSDKEFQDEKLALAIKQTPSNIKSGDPYNSTTLSVQWTGACGVAPITSKAVQTMLDNSKGNITFLRPALIDGTRFIYQFKTATTMGPAEVAAKLSAALSDTITAAGEGHPQPRMPTVKISNMQTFIS